MRVGQGRIDIQRALVLCDRRIELASFIEKCAVGVEQTRRFRAETDRVLVFGARFVCPTDTFEKISITGTDFAGAGIQLNRALIISFGFIELGLRHQHEGQVHVHFHVVGVDLESGVVFFFGFVDLAKLL